MVVENDNSKEVEAISPVVVVSDSSTVVVET